MTSPGERKFIEGMQTDDVIQMKMGQEQVKGLVLVSLMKRSSL